MKGRAVGADFSASPTAVKAWPLWEMGVAPTEIAERLGVSRQRVHQIAKKYGWVHPSQKPAHGTMKQYGRGCRCAACRKAAAERASKARRQRLSSGKVPPSVKHGAAAASNWGCKCDVCTIAVRERNARDTQRRAREFGNPSGRSEEQLAAHAEKQRRHNAEVKQAARRDGYQWTGPELEYVMRDDLTIEEMAATLGRTLFAVVGARRRCRTDPRMARLAGLDTPEARKATP